jgi:hypothetical protein
MVRQFTEEEKRRHVEEVQRHYDEYHGGERVFCNYYSECWTAEREERIARNA